jgi:hypothetical protein
VLVDDAGVEQTSWQLEVPWPPDLATVELLARWQLAARRGRQALYVLEAPAQLVELIDFAGLAPQLLDPSDR